jgi:hypothetical protein
MSDHPAPRRHALEPLAASPHGCTEAIMLAHGFTVRAGLATATAERVAMGPRTIEAARVKISDAGRRMIAKR